MSTLLPSSIPYVDGTDFSSIWIISESARTNNLLKTHLDGFGYQCTYMLSASELQKGMTNILTKLRKDKPSLIWFAPLHRDIVKPLDENIQVAVRLIASEQHSLNGHILLENCSTETNSRGVFINKTWLEENNRANMYPVFWCALELETNSKNKRFVGQNSTCAITSVVTTFSVPTNVSTCCRNAKFTGRSIMPNKLPKAYFAAMANVIHEVATSATIRKALKRQKPKPPKPTEDEGPGEHADGIEDFERPTAKKKYIEDHYDDCGDDVSTICLSCADNPCFSDSDSEDLDGEDFLSNDFYSWSALGSQTSTLEPLHHRSPDFTSLSQAYTAFGSQERYAGQHDIVEIFGGESGVTRLCIHRGCKGGPSFDLAVGIDLLDKHETELLFEYFRVYRPKVLIAGPPCTAFGPWSHYNKVHAHATWHKNHIIGIKLAELTVALCEIQAKHNRHYVVENPATSEIWKLDCFVKLFSKHETFYAYLDQCMVGLADPTGIATKKPTMFIASADCLVKRLRRSCNKSHQHAQLAGNVNGISRCKHAQVWPRRLVELLVEGVMECIRTKPVSAYPVARKGEASCPGCKAHARKDDPRHTREIDSCRFPNAEPITWECPACMQFRPSTHAGHSWDNTCQWSIAPKRARGYERLPNPLVDPKPKSHVKPTIASDIQMDSMPPKVGSLIWHAEDNLELITALDMVRDRDGWHVVLANPALVQYNARALRFPQPRLNTSEFPFRSTYVFFPDFSHMHGNWWCLEKAARYTEPEYEGRQPFGFSAPIAVFVFQQQRDPKEKETGNAAASTAASASLGPAALGNPFTRAMDKWDEEELSAQRDVGAPEPVVPPVEPPPPDEVNIVPEWSSFDLGASLRALRSSSEAMQNRALRRLHLRWWHASATRMKSLLSAAGVSSGVLKLVDPIVSTCAICRMWARPGHRSMTTTRFAQHFNEAVQCDLLFVEEFIILHLIDESIRWTATCLLKDKTTDVLLKAVTSTWIKLFGPMTSLISDQEGALTSESGAVWAEKWKIELRPKAKGQHAVIVERHHAILRDHIHKIYAQARSENLAVDFEDILSEATFVKNAMLQIAGTSPYVALLGRFPAVLAEFENQGQSAIQDTSGQGASASRHSVRLREIAVSSIAEALSQSRLRQAESSKTRISGEIFDYRTGELVEIYRQPQSKDLTGWRGPAQITDISTIERGHISVKWGGRTMLVRLQDVRRVALFIGLTDDGSEPLHIVRDHLLTLTKTVQTFGWIFNEQGWSLSKSAIEHPLVFKALLYVARLELGIVKVVAARIGRGICTLHGLAGFEIATMFWWPAARPNLYKTFEHAANVSLDLKPLLQLDDEGADVVWVQFLSTSSREARRLRRRNPEVPLLGDDPEDPRPPGPDSDWDTETVQLHQTPPPSPMSTQHDNPPWQPPPQPPRARRSEQPSPMSTTQEVPPPPQPWQPPWQSPPAPVRTTDSWKHPIMSDSYVPRNPVPSENSFRTRSDRRHNSTSRNNASPPTSTRKPIVSSHSSLPSASSASIASTIRVSSVPSKASSAAVSTPPNRSPVLSEQFVPSHRRELSPSASHSHAKRSNSLGVSPKTASATPSSAASSSWQGIAPAPTTSIPPLHVPLLPVDESETESDNTLPGDEFFWVKYDDETLILCFLAEDGKSVIERELNDLNKADVDNNWEAVVKAVRKELQSFVDLKSFKLAPIGTSKNLMTSRWVMRWKMVPNEKGVMIKTVKARLTIHGFKDSDADHLTTFAGTATRWGQRVVNSVATQNLWQLITADVGSAFLKGLTFKELAVLTGEPERRASFHPPKNYEPFICELKGFEKFDLKLHELYMNVPIYGLKDAPRAWRKRLHLALTALKGKTCKTDAALYHWHDNKGQLCLFLSAHVDDLKITGTQYMIQMILSELTKAFGVLKVQRSTFEHCGVIHTQHDDFSITTHQNHYVQGLKIIDTTAIDISKPKLALTKSQHDDYRSLLGGVSWLSQTRLDVCIYVQALQRAAQNPTIANLLRLNCVVRWIRRKPSFLHYKKLVGPLKVMVISDAAFRREDASGLAMRGAIIAISEVHAGTCGGSLHLIDFYSRRQRRVVRSTFGAELNSLLDALELGKLLCFTLAQLFCPNLGLTELRNLEDCGTFPIPLEAAVDCKSIFDSLKLPETKLPIEATLILLLLQVKEMLVKGSLRTLWWIDTRDMLADGLNKGLVSRAALLNTSATGNWILLHPAVQHTELKKVTRPLGPPPL